MNRTLVTISEIDPYYVNPSTTVELIRKNSRFRQLINTGRFVYVDNHFCLKEEKYLKKEGRNILGLSAYARKRTSECCINMGNFLNENAGKTVSRSSISGRRIKSRKVLIRTGKCYGEGRVVLRSRAKASKSLDSVKGISRSITNENRLVSEKATIAKEYNEFVREVLKEIPNSLCEAFKYLCDLSGLTDADIAAWSAVSEPTISRLKNIEDYKTDIKTLVKLCIGMQLPLEISLALLARAGMDIVRSTSRENRAYFMLISCCNEMPIEDCEKMFYEMAGKHLLDKKD